MPSSKTFPGVTPEAVSRFRAELAKQHIRVPDGDEGTIDHAGVKLSFQYDPARALLHVRLDDKPFIVSEAFVWNLLATALQSTTA
jgi:hypothetical protein